MDRLVPPDVCMERRPEDEADDVKEIEEEEDDYEEEDTEEEEADETDEEEDDARRKCLERSGRRLRECSGNSGKCWSGVAAASRFAGFRGCGRAGLSLRAFAAGA